MKTQAKTNISQYKRDQITTGGGECPKEPDDLDYSIADMIPDDFVKETALFDSDNIDNESVQDTPIVLEIIGEKGTVGDVVDNDAEENRKKNTPVKTDKITNKRRRYAKPTTAECMLEDRTATIKAGREESKNLFKKKLEIENLKIKQMEELHALEVEKKKKEIELLDLKIQKEKQTM